MKHYNEIFGLDRGGVDKSFNLHNHTVWSDGKHTVRQLIAEAIYKQISHLSITDHDTLDAYIKGNALALAKGFGINLIPGVEATVKFEEALKFRVHMLMYFDKKLLKDRQFLKDFKDSIGQARSNELFEKRLKSFNDIYDFGFKKSDFLSFAKDGNDFSGINMKAFYDMIIEKFPGEFSEGGLRTILGPEGPAYIDAGTSISDIMYMRNRYDMSLVYAHPFTKHTYKYKDQVTDIINNLINKKAIDGIEKHHPHHEESVSNIFNNFNVPIFTAGSDTHNLKDELSFYNTGVSNIINHDYNYLNRKGDLGLIVGRMNPPHMGHIRIIKNALNENGKVMLFLGSSNVINDKNPFDSKLIKYVLETYFKQEVADGKLIISFAEDVGDDKTWVGNIGKKIHNEFGNFDKKLSIYGGDFREDKAIIAFQGFQDELGIENINYFENDRDDFKVVNGKQRVDISATKLREALKKGDFELAKRFMPDEIGEMVIGMWKEKNNSLKFGKVFIVSSPEGNRNYFPSKNIKDQIESTLNNDYLVDNVQDADIIVTLGGDGSLLWAIKEYGNLGKPFYPIAAGTVNAIPANYENVYQIFSEDVEKIKLNLLEAKIFDDNKNVIGNIEGLNDIYLKAQSTETGHLVVESENYPPRTLIGDGVIVSTPVGSTAYNKNAGGSILDLHDESLIITDIVSTANKSHIISDESIVKITSIRGKFDIVGNNNASFEDFYMEVKKSNKFVEVILPKKEEFRQNRYKI